MLSAGTWTRQAASMRISGISDRGQIGSATTKSRGGGRMLQSTTCDAPQREEKSVTGDHNTAKAECQ